MRTTHADCRPATLLLAGAVAMLLTGCRPESPSPQVSGPFPQRGYLWQRDWTAGVAQAFAEASTRFDGVIILGGEIVWSGTTPRLVKSSPDWQSIARVGKPCALALRVGPTASPFTESETAVQLVVETARALVREAAESGVTINEFQLDYDCPQKKLAGYRTLLAALRAGVRPIPLSITALPSWLGEPELPSLLAQTDSYVLQVHSVPASTAGSARSICDPARAREWTATAAKLDRPFSVALPTYRCVAGFDDEGKLLGVAMDAVQPAWPAGTRLLEFNSDAKELARLIHDWTHARPANMTGVIWYRIPAPADLRNWRWPTLAAVMQGREPMHKLEIAAEGESPVDISLINHGEAEEHLVAEIRVAWEDATLLASDALPGWMLRATRNEAVFTPTGEPALRLLPGDRRGIGWLRYDRRPRIEARFASARPAPR